MSHREKLVVGNWKMHGNQAQNAVLLRGIVDGMTPLRSCRAAVCAPFPYLPQLQSLLAESALQWGAQDVSAEEQGAFTGQVSVSMLLDFGCTYVLVGHSERRAMNGEDNQLVAAKAARAVAAGMIPVICVGETLEQREAGRMHSVVSAQLGAVLDALTVDMMRRVVLAYEPVWAIGTGRTASPMQAQEVHSFLRAQVVARDKEAAARLTILYGGSVKPASAGELFRMPDIDGGLIGGASLVAEDFLAIARAASGQ